MKHLLRFTLLACLLAVTAFGALDQSQTYGLPSAIVVAKSDTLTYSPPIRSLFFSATAGQTITVAMAADGAQTLFTYGAAGTYILPVSVVKVYSAGTTVTGIVGLREQTGGLTHPTPTPSSTSTPTPTATASATSTSTPTPTAP